MFAKENPEYNIILKHKPVYMATFINSFKNNNQKEYTVLMQKLKFSLMLLKVCTKVILYWLLKLIKFNV